MYLLNRVFSGNIVVLALSGPNQFLGGTKVYAPTPLSVLRLAESVPETAENYPVLRELKKALEVLVNIAEAAK